MRLKHVSKADEIIEKSKRCIKNGEENKGQWKKSFSNNNPINIEIGTGKGKFIIEKAGQNPDVNFIGIERYSSVLYKAINKLSYVDKPYENLLFMCEDAHRITDFFEKSEISRIYLNFSDPWPKARHEKRRLTSHIFLDLYEAILINGGIVELKTDNVNLFDYSIESFESRTGWEIQAKTYDLYEDVMLSLGNVATEYEEKFVKEGKKICKLIAMFG